MNRRPLFKKASRLFSRAITDLLEGLKYWRYWYLRASILYRLDYRGSTLGWLWPILSLIFVVSVIGTVWGVLLNKNDIAGYYVYLLSGLATWQALSGSVNRASNGFGSISELNDLPLSSIVFEKTFASLLPFAHLFPVIFIVSIIHSETLGSNLLYIPVSAFILITWCLGASMTVLVAVTFIPDAKHIISSLMRLSFLATPIIWEAGKLGKYEEYIWLNPFYPPLQAMRYALTGQGENIMHEAMFYSSVLFIIGFILFSRFINRIRSHAVTQCAK